MRREDGSFDQGMRLRLKLEVEGTIDGDGDLNIDDTKSDDIGGSYIYFASLTQLDDTQVTIVSDPNPPPIPPPPVFTPEEETEALESIKALFLKEGSHG